MEFMSEATWWVSGTKAEASFIYTDRESRMAEPDCISLPRQSPLERLEEINTERVMTAAVHVRELLPTVIRAKDGTLSQNLFCLTQETITIARKCNKGPVDILVFWLCLLEESSDFVFGVE